MAAEIIFDADRGMEEQMQEVLAHADEADLGNVHWYPRPNKPHGGVVQVPDHIAERHGASQAERRREAALAALPEPDEGEPDDAEFVDQSPLVDDTPPPPETEAPPPAETPTTGRRRRGTPGTTEVPPEAPAEESGGGSA